MATRFGRVQSHCDSVQEDWRGKVVRWLSGRWQLTGFMSLGLVPLAEVLDTNKGIKWAKFAELRRLKIHSYSVFARVEPTCSSDPVLHNFQPLDTFGCSRAKMYILVSSTYWCYCTLYWHKTFVASEVILAPWNNIPLPPVI